MRENLHTHTHTHTGNANLTCVQKERHCAAAFKGMSRWFERARGGDIGAIADPGNCGKMKVLLQLLSIWRQEGAHTLVFSHSLSILAVIEVCGFPCPLCMRVCVFVLACACPNMTYAILGPQAVFTMKGVSYVKMDGTMNTRERQAAIASFNKGTYDVFLLSMGAGHLGISLTVANKIVIFDPSWNPSEDQQVVKTAMPKCVGATLFV